MNLTGQFVTRITRLFSPFLGYPRYLYLREEVVAITVSGPFCHSRVAKLEFDSLTFSAREVGETWGEGGAAGRGVGT